MNRQSLTIATALVTATMVIAALMVGSALPAGSELPIHFGVDGKPDRFADKWTALLLPPLITAFMSLLFYALPALEPKEKGLARSQGVYLWGWAAMLLMFAVVELAVVSEALGWDIPVNRLIIAGLGVYLIIVGNQLGKTRPMFMIGVRTPWTLASEEVWIKTHRLAGKLMVAAGASMLIASLLPLGARLLAGVMVGAAGGAALIPIVYSYFLWRQEKRHGQLSE